MRSQSTTDPSRFTIIDPGHALRNEESASQESNALKISPENLLHIQIHFPGNAAQAAKFLKRIRTKLSPQASEFSIDCTHSFVRPFSVEVLGLEAWQQTLHTAFQSHVQSVVAMFECFARTVSQAEQWGILNGYLTPRDILNPQLAFVLVDTRNQEFEWETASDTEILECPPEKLAPGSTVVPSCCDCYALGSLLFQMLCNRRVFQVQGEALRDSIIQDDPELAHDINPLVSESLSAICDRALARKAYWRYQDGAELADDLRDLLAHKRTRADRSRRRRAVRSGSKAAVALVLCILSAIGIWLTWPILCDLQNDYDVGIDSLYEDSGGGY